MGAILKLKKACVAEWLRPRTPDLEVRGSRLACRVVSLDEELHSTLSLFTQVYKWVPATYCWGQPCDELSSRPGEVTILLGMLHANETGISSGRVGL